jgi:dihydropteroate synthase
MGIVNVTPDSFSDGGAYFDVHKAHRHAMQLIEDGADVIDIGGESARPGAEAVSLKEELHRILPVIQSIRKVSDVCISVDTCKPEVMKAAVDVGASMINDITALRSPGSLNTVADLNVPVCLMHMQGTPRSMQEQPNYPNGLVEEINTFFMERIEVCLQAGIDRSMIVLDPGFGFGKSVDHNLQLLRNIKAFQAHHQPVLLGVSRKSTLGVILQKDVSDRLIGGIAIAAYALLQGIDMLRTHDVKETQQALDTIHWIVG